MLGDAAREESRILIVDDQEPNVRLLERILHRAGYREIMTTTDPRAALDLFSRFEPDVVLLDLLMPHVDGFEVMRRLELLVPSSDYRPVLVLTADATQESKRRALAGGAKDFLTKPFDPDEVVLRIGNMLETRRLHQLLQGQNEVLEEQVRERTLELEQAYLETFEKLALAAEYRDDATGQHTLRVGRMASLVGRELGLSEPETEGLQWAAGLHDVGKIGIPDHILLAPRKLTPEEFEVVKTHTWIGAKMLSGSRSSLLQTAEKIAWSHHERWDGTGYAGVAGEDIPLVGRITAVADVFDALTHARPYSEPWPVERAIREVRGHSGSQFDPQVVEAFLSVQKGHPDLALPA
jgi:putative two-component system response regulator